MHSYDWYETRTYDTYVVTYNVHVHVKRVVNRSELVGCFSAHANRREFMESVRANKREQL